MGKGIFIAENMASTKLVSLLRSAVNETEVMENGSIVVLGDLVDGEQELYKTKNVAEATDAIYVVDGVELEADEQLTRGLDDFVNPIGQATRVRKLMSGDIFSVSKSMIEGVVSAGKLVEPAVGNKLKLAATATAGATTCVVQSEWIFGNRAIPMVRLEVK